MKPALRAKLPLAGTALLWLALFVLAGVLYDGFASPRVFSNLLADNAVLGIVAVGMTLVIFSGGIDLSVGAVVGLTSVLSATLLSRGVPPGIAAALCLGLGAGLGCGMGALIHCLRLPAFLITLAGMFLARGCAFWISTESTAVQHEWVTSLSQLRPEIAGAAFPAPSLILLAVLACGYLLAHHTRFGRNLLAIGGGEQSALLMGLPVGPTRITAYTLNGALAALAGLVAVLYTGSGNPGTAIGLELDAIAVVVIGGTLLSGGRGHLLGTLCGLLVFGTIQSALLFDGRLSSWWIRIVIALLLLGFILLQRAVQRQR